LHAQLSQWAKNDATLQSLVQRSSLVKDAAPASSAFAQAVGLALSSLDRIRQELPLSEDERRQRIEALNAYESQAHQSLLTIPATAAFQKLIEAATVGRACAATE
jgi:hypothetical protein